jgi:hypothetical protein
MPTEDNRKCEAVAAVLTARRTPTIPGLPAPGMTTIEVDPTVRGADVISQAQGALKVLHQAGVSARRRVRSLATKALIQVADADAERAVQLLVAAQMRVAIRPS